MSTIQRECKQISLLENEQFNTEKSNSLRHLVCGHVLGPCQQFFESYWDHFLFSWLELALNSGYSVWLKEIAHCH